MSVNRPSRPITRPAARGIAVSSMPLGDAELYRPGPYFALVVLLIPVVVTVVGAAISLNSGQGIPVWLPFALLLWIPCLPVVWLGLLSVRADSVGIAAGRPWGRWNELEWGLIERVEQRGPLIRIKGSQGVTVTVMPALLRDGDRLTRRLLLRLPSHVLSEALAHEAQQILTTSIYTMPEGGLSGLLSARPRGRYRLTAAALLLAFAGLGVALALIVSGVVGIVLGAICGIGALISAVAYLWLSQEVQVNDKGVTTIASLTRRKRGMLWTQIALVEHSAGEALLRLHGEQRMICVGPGLLAPAHRALMRAFLHEYCMNRDVPIVKRRFLI